MGLSLLHIEAVLVHKNEYTLNRGEKRWLTLYSEELYGRWKIMSEIPSPVNIWLFTQNEAIPTKETDKA